MAHGQHRRACTALWVKGEQLRAGGSGGVRQAQGPDAGASPWGRELSAHWFRDENSSTETPLPEPVHPQEAPRFPDPELAPRPPRPKHPDGGLIPRRTQSPSRAQPPVWLTFRERERERERNVNVRTHPSAASCRPCNAGGTDCASSAVCRSCPAMPAPRRPDCPAPAGSTSASTLWPAACTQRRGRGHRLSSCLDSDGARACPPSLSPAGGGHRRSGRRQTRASWGSHPILGPGRGPRSGAEPGGCRPVAPGPRGAGG